MAAVVVAALVLFIRHECRVEEPIIDLTLFADSSFRLMAMAAFLTDGAFLCSIVFIPLFMVNVLDFSATRAGATVMPLTLGLVTANITSGRLASRIGSYKPILVPALVLASAALLLFSLTLNAKQSQLLIVAKLFLVGLGLGPSIPMLKQMMVNHVSRQKIGMASSTAAFVRQLGNTVGLAVYGTVLTSILAVAVVGKMQPALQPLSAAMPELEISVAGSSGESRFDADQLLGKIENRYQVLLTHFQQQPSLTAEDWQLLGLDSTSAKQMSPSVLTDLANQRLTQAKTNIKVAEQAFKDAWVRAVRAIFLAAMIVVVCGLLAVMLIPEVPFRELGNSRGEVK